MTLPELTELAKVLAPGLAGLASLAHPVAALVRRRRANAQLRQLIHDEMAAGIELAMRPLTRRVEALERRIERRRVRA